MQHRERIALQMIKWIMKQLDQIALFRNIAAHVALEFTMGFQGGVYAFPARATREAHSMRHSIFTTNI
jgi:hypothetical protein